MAGFNNDTVVATNVDFSGGFPVTGKITLDGQLIIGRTALNAGGTHIDVATLTAGTGVSITNGPGSITIALNGSVAGETITGNTGGALSPVAGNWNILGSVLSSGTNPVSTDGSGNTLSVRIQTSQAIAATNATKIGLSNFDSSSFAVDANGFVTASTTGLLKTLTGNSGGAIAPVANNINTLGTGSITIAGAGSTLTTQLTGLTANSVLYGLGTATIGLVASGTTGQVLQTNTGAAPTYSTATYPSTTVVSQLLYSSSTNVVGGLTTGNDGVLITSHTGVPSWLANGTTGQLLTATTNSPPTWTTVTTVFPWTDTSGTVTAASNNGYFITTTCTSTLPAAPAQGDVVKYIVDTTNLLTITGNTGQLIRLANTITAAAGTAVNTLRGDSIELVYRSATTTWESLSSNGQWNLT